MKTPIELLAICSRIHVDPAESISSKLVPVRPIAVTAGAISLKANQVLQIL